MLTDLVTIIDCLANMTILVGLEKLFPNARQGCFGPETCFYV